MDATEKTLTLFTTRMRQMILRFDELKKEKKLFLRKGLKVGKKYYISYLLFSISPKLLRLVIR